MKGRIQGWWLSRNESDHSACIAVDSTWCFVKVIILHGSKFLVWSLKSNGSMHRLVIQKLSMRNMGQAYAEQILSSRGCIDVKILLRIFEGKFLIDMTERNGWLFHVLRSTPIRLWLLLFTQLSCAFIG